MSKLKSSQALEIHSLIMEGVSRDFFRFYKMALRNEGKAREDRNQGVVVGHTGSSHSSMPSILLDRLIQRYDIESLKDVGLLGVVPALGRNLEKDEIGINYFLLVRELPDNIIDAFCKPARNSNVHINHGHLIPHRLPK